MRRESEYPHMDGDVIQVSLEEAQARRPWDKIEVQRWQLDWLVDGLRKLDEQVSGVDLGDRSAVAAKLGYAGGAACALRWLVESMLSEKCVKEVET